MIYVDLWSDSSTRPKDLLLSAARRTLTDLEQADSKVLSVLKRVKGLDFGAAGLKFSFNLTDLGLT